MQQGKQTKRDSRGLIPSHLTPKGETRGVPTIGKKGEGTIGKKKNGGSATSSTLTISNKSLSADKEANR